MKAFIFFTSLLLFTSCKYFRGDHCNNTKPIIGIYENVYDKKSKNLLIIKEDGTFEQKFIKDGITQNNFGFWEFFDESCNVKLINLKLMHKVPNQYRKYFGQKGKYRLNKIVFIEDLPKEFDFYRIE